MAHLNQIVHEFESSRGEISRPIFNLSQPLTSLGRRHDVHFMEGDIQPLRDFGINNVDAIKSSIDIYVSHENLRRLHELDPISLGELDGYYETESLAGIRTIFQHDNLFGDFAMQLQHLLHHKYQNPNFPLPDIFKQLLPVYLPNSRPCSPQHKAIPPHQRSSYSELSANVTFLHDLEREKATPLRPEAPQRVAPSTLSRTPKKSPPRPRRPKQPPSASRIKRTPQQIDPQKKQQMACFFCRERKIACGGPISVEDGDQTCRQCKNRGKVCTYAAESRRGHHRRVAKLRRIAEEYQAAGQGGCGEWCPNC